MEELTKEAVADTGVTGRNILRSKNMFALGLISWIFGRPVEPTLNWLQSKFKDKAEVGAANAAALRAGYNYGITTEAFQRTFEVKPASLPPGTYTNVTGNQAIAWGLIAESDIELWVHGHTLHSVSYSVGETRVLSNQRCYPNEDPGAFDPGLVIEV